MPHGLTCGTEEHYTMNAGDCITLETEVMKSGLTDTCFSKTKGTNSEKQNPIASWDKEGCESGG